MYGRRIFVKSNDSVPTYLIFPSSSECIWLPTMNEKSSPKCYCICELEIMWSTSLNLCLIVWCILLPWWHPATCMLPSWTLLVLYLYHLSLITQREIPPHTQHNKVSLFYCQLPLLCSQICDDTAMDLNQRINNDEKRTAACNCCSPDCAVCIVDKVK